MSERTKCDHPSSDGYGGIHDNLWKCCVCGQLHTSEPTGVGGIERTVNVKIVPADDFVLTKEEADAIQWMFGDTATEDPEHDEWDRRYDAARAVLSALAAKLGGSMSQQPRCPEPYCENGWVPVRGYNGDLTDENRRCPRCNPAPDANLTPTSGATQDPRAPQDGGGDDHRET